MARTTVSSYLKKRFLRLMVPLIVYLFCAGDIVSLMVTKRLYSINLLYIDLFLNYWRDFFSDFGIRFMLGGKSSQNTFQLQHAWFLSFLFFTTIVIVLLSKLKKISKTVKDTIESRNKIIGKTLLISLIISLLFITGVVAVVSQGISPGIFMRIGLFAVRTDQVFLLLLLAIFGLYVYKKDWLIRGDIGSWMFWGLMSLTFLALLALVVYYKFMPVAEQIMKVSEHNLSSGDHRPMPVLTESFKVMWLVFYMLTALSCMFLLMFFLSFFKRFLNRPNPVTTFCSKHSIYVYVLHLTPIVLLQYAFKDVVMPPMVKIILITIIVIPACLWLSHRLVYPHPKIAIGFFVSLKLVALLAGFDFYYYALLGITFVSFAGAVVEGGRYFLEVRNAEPEMSEAG